MESRAVLRKKWVEAAINSNPEGTRGKEYIGDLADDDVMDNEATTKYYSDKAMEPLLELQPRLVRE